MNRRHLRLADAQDITLAQLTAGQEVQVSMQGTLIETYSCNGTHSHVVEVPDYGRVTITPTDGHTITPVS